MFVSEHLRTVFAGIIAMQEKRVIHLNQLKPHQFVEIGVIIGKSVDQRKIPKKPAVKKV